MNDVEACSASEEFMSVPHFAIAECSEIKASFFLFSGTSQGTANRRYNS
jgi:hypothetical protein